MQELATLSVFELRFFSPVHGGLQKLLPQVFARRDWQSCLKIAEAAALICEVYALRRLNLHCDLHPVSTIDMVVCAHGIARREQCRELHVASLVCCKDLVAAAN